MPGQRECPQLKSLADLIKLAGMLFIILLSIVPQVSALSNSPPVVEITVGPVADDYADSMYQMASQYGSRLALYVGNSYDRVQNVSGPARIYIKFDGSVIPRGARILSAELALYQMFAPESRQNFEMHMVLEAWNESAITWKKQPVSDSAVISATLAPAEKNVWVTWNVTSAVQAWVNGNQPNYGLMIRIHNEKYNLGASEADEASGFYSREYLKEDVQPRLRVLSEDNPPFTYMFQTRVAGLPAELSSVIKADNGVTIKVAGGGIGYFLFASETQHVLTADEFVNPADSVRYHANTHSTTAMTRGEFTFTYEPQFRVTVKSDPAGLIEREWSDWYDQGVSIRTPSARAVIEQGPETRLVLDGWYVNGVKQSGNPIDFIADRPADLTAKYTLMHNVTVSSPYGAVSGSGWHPAGSNVEISVSPAYVPASGVPGYLGIGMSFDHWTGSFESTSPITTITLEGPTRAKAVWREDRSRFVIAVAVAVGLVLVFTALLLRTRRSRVRKPAPPHAAGGKPKAKKRTS